MVDTALDLMFIFILIMFLLACIGLVVVAVAWVEAGNPRLPYLALTLGVAILIMWCMLLYLATNMREHPSVEVGSRASLEHDHAVEVVPGR